MSVNNILDANNKILETYLPSGDTPSNTYCDNPMTETLVGDGFDIIGVSTFSCDKVVMDLVPTVLTAQGAKIQIAATENNGESGQFACVPGRTYCATISFKPDANATAGTVMSLGINYPLAIPITQTFWNKSAADFNASNDVVYTENISFVAPSGVVAGKIQLNSTLAAPAPNGTSITVQNCIVWQVLNGPAP